MDKRTALILLLLFVPVLALALWSQSTTETDRREALRVAAGEQNASPAEPAPRKPLSLEDARLRARAEVERLDSLSPQQWDAEQQRRADTRKRRARQAEEMPAPQKDAH